MYWEHFPGTYPSRFKAEVLSLSSGFGLCKRTFKVFSFWLFTSWEPLSPAQDRQEPAPGQSGSRVWSEAGPLSSQTRAAGSPLASQGLNVSKVQVKNVSAFRVQQAACLWTSKRTATSASTWLHSVALAPHPRRGGQRILHSLLPENNGQN